MKEAGFRGVGNGRHQVVNDVAAQQRARGQRPGGDGEGLRAGSRDRQEIDTLGGSSLGFGVLDQGVSS